MVCLRHVKAVDADMASKILTEPPMKIALLFVNRCMDAEAAAALRSAGLSSESFASLAALQTCVRDVETAPDAIVLEASESRLPTWLAALRPKAAKRLPMLVLGRAESAVLVDALLHGADDYVLMRDDGHELVVRIQAHVRKHIAQSPTRRRAGECWIDARRCTVTHAGREVALTSKEFFIASRLLDEVGGTVSADALRAAAWGPCQPTGRRALEPHIHSLRRKCASAFGPSMNIRVVHGMGYRLDTFS
jgi:DNA-binding response OmpR family regulator